MSSFKKLSHTLYECKYHIVFCPKYRHRIFEGQIGKRYWGRHLWSRGYCVSTIDLDEDQIRKYVRWQERRDKESEQLGLAF
jgi:putative transposase